MRDEGGGGGREGNRGKEGGKCDDFLFSLKK